MKFEYQREKNLSIDTLGMKKRVKNRLKSQKKYLIMRNTCTDRKTFEMLGIKSDK